MVSTVTRHGRQPADQIILADQLRGALASSAASVCATCRRSDATTQGSPSGSRRRLISARTRSGRRRGGDGAHR